MRNLLLTATVLLSSAAFGQFGSTIQVTVQSVANTDALSIGPDACGQSSAFNWKVVGTPCADLSLWITTDSDCKETSSAQTSGSVRELSSISRNTISTSGGSGTANFQVSSLPIFNASTTDGGSVTCSADVEVEDTMLLCASTKAFDAFGACSTTVVKATAPLEITYDTKRPGAPSISDVAALDKALQVTVDPPDDATQVRVVALLAGTEISRETKGVGLGAIKLQNLVNDTTYQLEAYAIDGAGNVSATFDTGEGTPNRTLGYYERYRERGGEETGCGATGGGFAGGALLAALGFWLSSRRNRS